MIPAVTVCSRPKGEPIASTQSPTLSLSESPIFAIGSVLLDSIFTTARSVCRSMPTIFASVSVESQSFTRILFARRTTCAFVRIKPAELTMTPEPVPSRPYISLSYTLMCATQGSTSRATFANVADNASGVPGVLLIVSRLSSFALTISLTIVPTAAPTDRQQIAARIRIRRRCCEPECSSRLLVTNSLFVYIATPSEGTAHTVQVVVVRPILPKYNRGQVCVEVRGFQVSAGITVLWTVRIRSEE